VTINRGMALLVPVILAGTLASASGPAAGPGTSVAQLKAISARLSGQGASLLIEASEPAAYVATRPDALTLLLDFRNVGADGVANRFAVSAKSPIAGVAIEAVESLGAPVSRVRITLAQPVAHRVHSDRNTIVVDFDKPSGGSDALPPLARRGPDAMAALEPAAPRSADPVAVLGLAPGSIRATISSDPLRSPAEAPDGAGRVAAKPSAAQALAPPPQPPQAVLEPQTPRAPQTPQAPPTPSAPQPIGAPRTARTFSGNPVSLDFQGADLRAVLRTFSEISGLNMVIDPSVQGTVDVALRDVPWDQALDIILRANKLGYIVDGTIVRIAPLTVLADEESQKRKLADEQALAGDLRLLTKTLSYAKAEVLQALLTKSALSPRGTVQVDPRTNTLIISDLEDRLQTASDLIAALDKPQPQVEIEARIVQTNKTYARALGIQWGFQGRADPTLGNTTNLAFPNNGAIGGRVGGTQGVTGNAAGTVPTAVNLPAAGGATSAIGLALGAINGAFNLDVALSALESSGNVRLLSTPRVSTQNNIPAEITQGVQVPFQTVANNTVTTSFKDAALTLKVTPQITAAGTVIMQIAVDNGSVGAVFNGVPSINTQRATTTVQVNDMETTVIGGIYASSENVNNDRTPGLSRIPLLKWMFRRDSMNDSNSELLIFITPRIIKG
jgi:type IV pilus secretin PilQ/predicted competence protein